jgi:predicted DNA-binding transcriptional regulator AlpA
MANLTPDDLVDASEVAALIGLSNPRSIPVYRARYPDFPAPFVVKASGKCVLWLRADVEAWAARRSSG